MASNLDSLTEDLAELLDEPAPRIDPRTLPIRFSRLKSFALSPAHYLEAAQQRDRRSSEPQRVGQAVHAMVLGSETPVVKFNGRRFGKTWDAFQADHPDALILSAREHYEASQISSAVLCHKEAMQLLSHNPEHVIPWQHLGRDCCSTPDAHGPYGVADLKTTTLAKPSHFPREALRLFYHVQLAAYSLALEHHTGTAPSAAYIVAVEKRPPYPVVVYRLTERAIEQGRQTWAAWFNMLLTCEATNAWPAYSDAIVDLDTPEDEGAIWNELEKTEQAEGLQW